MKSTGTAKAPVPAVPLSTTTLAELEWQVQQLQLAIARRAFEWFQARDCEHGHDWEDWFRAESELLKPVSIAISESKTRISIRANVLGFEAKELKVSVAPDRVIIIGVKQPAGLDKPPGAAFYPGQLFRMIELPLEVQPDSAHIQFEDGVLRIELPKAIKPETQIGPRLL
jgi:HSP20 family protein